MFLQTYRTIVDLGLIMSFSSRVGRLKNYQFQCHTVCCQTLIHRKYNDGYFLVWAVTPLCFIKKSLMLKNIYLEGLVPIHLENKAIHLLKTYKYKLEFNCDF